MSHKQCWSFVKVFNVSTFSNYTMTLPWSGPARQASVFQKKKAFTNREYFTKRPKYGFQFGVWWNRVDLSDLNLVSDVVET